MGIKGLRNRRVELRVNHILHLSAYLRYLLKLLNSGLVALESGLDDLSCFLLACRKLFKTLRILLFLLKQHLIILAGLLRLVNQLLNHLLTLMKGLACLIVVCELHVVEFLLWFDEHVYSPLRLDYYSNF